MDIYFIPWILFNLFLKLAQIWPWQIIPNWFLCPFNMLTPKLFLGHSYFLAPDFPGSSHIFHASILEWAIFPRTQYLLTE